MSKRHKSSRYKGSRCWCCSHYKGNGQVGKSVKLLRELGFIKRPDSRQIETIRAE